MVEGKKRGLRRKGVVISVTRFSKKQYAAFKATFKRVTVKSIKKNPKPVAFALTAVLLVVSLVVSLILPGVTARAERTLTWSGSGDFAYNKISRCEKTTVSNVTITGVGYTDASCAADGSNESMKLIGQSATTLSGVVMVAGGIFHSIALKSDGSVWAWGRNASGQLGDNTNNTALLPVRVKDGAGTGYLSGIESIGAGDSHSAALKSDGTVWAWGDNSYGQLGVNTTTGTKLPVQVKNITGDGFLSGAESLTVGDYHNSVVLSDGTALIWGRNNFGQIGNNTTTNALLPIQVKDSAGTGYMSGVLSIEAGAYHTNLLRSDGTVWAWGYNAFGQIGNNSGANALLPVQVKDIAGTGYLSGVSSIAAGGYHTVALLSDGSMLSWGQNNSGQLGNGTRATTLLPIRVRDSSGAGYIGGVVSIEAGNYLTFAVDSAGNVYAWGNNAYGQVGNNTIDNAPLPVRVKDSAGTGYIARASRVASTGTGTLMLDLDGNVWSWGSNTYGQNGMGAGGLARQLLPDKVLLSAGTGVLSNVASAVSSANNTFAVKTDGSVWAWGQNDYGQLGNANGYSSEYPIRVRDSSGTGYLSDVSQISIYSNFVMALKTDGTVWAWGQNSRGQLGVGTSTSSQLPVQVKDSLGTGYLTGVVYISAGSSTALAVKSDGTVWAWGYNAYGQLGVNTTADTNLPVQVKNSDNSGFMMGATKVFSGPLSSYAIKSDGSLWAWGHNGAGQLGNNTTTASSLPVQVKDSTGSGYITNVTSVSANGVSSTSVLATRSDGTAWAWGYNYSGQLGIGPLGDVRLPTQIRDAAGTGYLTNVVSVAAGGTFGLAVQSDGAVWSWGASTYGELGNGSTSSNKPVQVKDSTATANFTGGAKVFAGTYHATVLTTSGTLYSWGQNTDGRLGNTTLTNANYPTTVVGTGGYAASGLVSGFVVDVGAARRTKWNAINWNTQQLPAGGSVAFSIRTSKDGTNWSNWSSDFIQSTKDSVSYSANLESITMSRFAELRVKLATSVPTSTPQLNDFSLSFVDDQSAPITNAENIVITKGQGGAAVADGAWSNISPYISWGAAEDNTGGSGIWGYCVYLGHDEAANPTQAAGLLGASPIDSNGACPYVTASTTLNLAQSGVLASALESASDPYYVSLRAIDNTGNIYTDEPATYSFKFDNVPPKNPSFISAPAGFVANKDVSLTWPSSGDDAPSDTVSGVAGLQYRVGNAGTWYGDTHSGAGDLSDLLANDGSYRTDATFDYPLLSEGNNIIYFRTYDAAGNVSSTYSTAAIKINTSAPSSPQNVTATPTTSTTNAFAFEWGKPATFVGAESGLSYCYSVNSLPSASTCIYTTETSLAADAYATQPGDNTLYVVARDESGNVNYATYESVTFTANTPAPGVATSFEIADISTKATATWKLALSWNAPAEAGSGVARYQVYRSADGTNFTQVATTSGRSYVDADLSQLEYSYKIKACDSANNCGAFSSVAMKMPTGRYTSPPELVNGPSVETSTRSASFNWVTDRASDSRVQYGVESGTYLPGEVTVSDETKVHGVEIANLDAGTTYYYRVKWTDEDGNTGTSNEFSFTTLPAPVIKSVDVAKTTLTSTVISIVSRDATRVSLYYGTTEDFGGVKSINTSLAESQYDIELAGLKDGSKYYFKIVTTDADGNVYDSNRIDTFTTPPRPRISNLRMQPVEGAPTSTQNVSWTTNVPTSSLVTYGVSGTNGSDIYDGELTTSHEITVSNLEDDSDYFLIAQGRDVDGNLAVSDRQTFRTALDTRPPVISGVRVETSVTGTGSEASGQVIVYWKTDEPAKSQVAYAIGSGVTEFTNYTAEDARLTTDHIVIISNLSVSTIYSLRPISADGADNETAGSTQSAIIGRPTESVLDIVVNALSRLFAL